MIKMIRTFHPVGHGAFYTEKFQINDGKKLNFVYDCGSKSKKRIENEIDITFDENETIDLLAISHFHNDHINGLEHLLKRCNVKNIILPLLHEEQKKEFLLDNLESSNFVQNLCLNPTKAIKEISRNKDTKVVFVSAKLNEKDNIELSNLVNESEVKSGTIIKISIIPNWIYVPFNLEYKKRNEEVERGYIKKILISFLKHKKYKEIRKYIKYIKISYNKIGKGINKDKPININSMVVFSGINGFKCSSEIIVSTISYTKINNVGCLYTGDYNAKGYFDELDNKILKKYKSKISIIQIRQCKIKFAIFIYATLSIERNGE